MKTTLYQSVMKKKNKKHKIKLNKMIYVKLSEEDDYGIDSVMARESPKMVQERLDLPFHMRTKDWDENTHYPIEIFAKEDWGKVKWKTGELKDKYTEPAHFEAALIYFHGGGWVIGNTVNFDEYTKALAHDLD